VSDREHELKLVDVSNVPSNLNLKELDWYWETYKESEHPSRFHWCEDKIGHSREVVKQAILLHGFNPDEFMPPSAQMQRKQDIADFVFKPRHPRLVGSYVTPDGKTFPAEQEGEARGYVAQLELGNFLEQVLSTVGIDDDGNVNITDLVQVFCNNADAVMELLEPSSSFILMNTREIPRG
jgi:hypothetical protein